MAKTSKTDLKQFRAAVSVLKKKGLISNIDARSAQPHYIRQGKTLKETVARYDDIVSGKVEPVKLSKQKLSEYKKAGYHTTKAPGGQTFVMVPKTATEKVSVSRGGEIKIEQPKSGIKRIKYAVPYKNLPQWLRDMKKAAPKVDAMKTDREWFVYKFFGHNSWNQYEDIDLLIYDLENGTDSGPAIMDTEKLNYNQGAEVYQNIEIMTWPKNRPYPKPQRKKSPTSKAARKRYMQRVKNTPVGAHIREQHRKDEANRRANMTAKEKEKYKNAAKKRAAKSRKKKAAKSGSGSKRKKK